MFFAECSDLQELHVRADKTELGVTTTENSRLFGGLRAALADAAILKRRDAAARKRVDLRQQVALLEIAMRKMANANANASARAPLCTQTCCHML